MKNEFLRAFLNDLTLSITELDIAQEAVPAAIPVEACYLGWQESLTLLTKLVDTEFQISRKITLWNTENLFSHTFAFNFRYSPTYLSPILRQ